MATLNAEKPKAKAKPTTKPPDENAIMPLNRALLVIKEKYPWMPGWSIRQAVLNGQVPCVRSSAKKGARYYVRIADLLKVLPGATQPQPTT